MVYEESIVLGNNKRKLGNCGFKVTWCKVRREDRVRVDKHHEIYTYIYLEHLRKIRGTFKDVVIDGQTR